MLDRLQRKLEEHSDYLHVVSTHNTPQHTISLVRKITFKQIVELLFQCFVVVYVVKQCCLCHVYVMFMNSSHQIQLFLLLPLKNDTVKIFTSSSNTKFSGEAWLVDLIDVVGGCLNEKEKNRVVIWKKSNQYECQMCYNVSNVNTQIFLSESVNECFS